MPIPVASLPRSIDRPLVAEPRWSAPLVSLTDSDGTTIVLGDPYWVMPGAQGIGIAPVQLFSDAFPQDDGSGFRGVRLGERDVFLPIFLGGSSFDHLRDLRRALERHCDPTRNSRTNTVTVTLSQPDTTERRSVTAWYVGGMEGSYGTDEAGADWQTFGLLFRALDPFWYADPVALSFRAATGSVFLSATVLFGAAALASSQVLGEVTIDNPGDVDSYPVWTVTGPGASLTLTNLTTGAALQLTGPFAAGDVVTIDTRRALQTVVNHLGNNLWPNLSNTSALWPLVPGEQQVQIELVSATAASLVEVMFSTRHATAG